jgi:hypothetical protein
VEGDRAAQRLVFDFCLERFTMTKPRFILTVALVATVLGLQVVQTALATDSGSIPARMDTFTHPDGANYFALSLEPKGISPAAKPRDVVVMFNTSASQIGAFRTKSFEALQAILAGLGPQDRVQLVRVDLNAIPLTKSFVAPDSTELTCRRHSPLPRTVSRPVPRTPERSSISAMAAVLRNS